MAVNRIFNLTDLFLYIAYLLSLFGLDNRQQAKYMIIIVVIVLRLLGFYVSHKINNRHKLRKLREDLKETEETLYDLVTNDCKLMIPSIEQKCHELRVQLMQAAIKSMVVTIVPIIIIIRSLRLAIIKLQVVKIVTVPYGILFDWLGWLGWYFLVNIVVSVLISKIDERYFSLDLNNNFSENSENAS